MTPTTIELIIGTLLKYGPVVAAEVKNLLSKSDPTSEDIDALLARVTALSQPAARAKAEAEYLANHPVP